MNQPMKIQRLALLVCVAIGVSSSTATADKKAAPPNWKVSAAGSSTFESLTIDEAGVPFRTDIDAFSGNSSHLGKFTATGRHQLNLVTGEFEGVAIYTAADGDELHVIYAGQLYPSEDVDFPYGVIADVEICGGTGRFTDASGGGDMIGGFTGEVPVGEFVIDIQGTLSTK
jgi:hypothetical protein